VAKERVPLGPSRYTRDSDKHSILLWVEANQVYGTVGKVSYEQHAHLENATETTMAMLRGEAKDKDFPALLRLARQLLDTAEKTWKLRQERDSGSNN
jgi:hypothetical protein